MKKPITIIVISLLVMQGAHAGGRGGALGGHLSGARYGQKELSPRTPKYHYDPLNPRSY